MLGEVGIERRVAVDAGGVVLDDFFERLESSVVHVGRGEGDVAEAGRGELAVVGVLPRDGSESEVGFEIEAIVVKAVVREESASVTVEAVRTELFPSWIVLFEEEFEAALLLLGEFPCTVASLIKAGVEGGLGEEELLDGNAQAFGGGFTRSEGGFEQTRVGGMLGEFGLDVVERLVHLRGVLNRHEDLIAKRGSAAIPEEGVFPREVHQRHGMAGADLTVDADAEGAGIGEGMGRVMTRRATDAAIAGKGGVIEEAAAQLDALLRQRVIGRQWRDREVGLHLETVGCADLGNLAVLSRCLERRRINLVEGDEFEGSLDALFQRHGEDVTLATVS